MKKILTLIGVLICFLGFGQFGTDVFTIGSDNASNYGGSWTNGSNQGSGFGAWSISAGTNTGVFVGNPGNDGMGTAGIGTSAFAIYATGSNYINITRTINNGLRVGDVITFYWAMNFDAGAGSKGFNLKSGSTTIFNVNNAGSSTISTTNGNANTNYGTSPMLVTLERISSSSYSFSMTARDGGATYTTTISSSSTIDEIEIYSGNQNDGAGQKNIYFNNFTITSKYTIPSSQTSTVSSNISVPYIDIQSGGTLISEASNSRELTISSNGNFTNNGTFTANDGKVIFSGSNTVSGSSTFNNIDLNGGVDFGSSSTVNGNISLNAGGFINTNAPSYGGSSILIYNSSTTYGRGTEWSSTSGAGYPNNIQITNNTTLNLGANTGTGTARQCAGNLTVDAGSTLSLNESGEQMTQALTVKGNFINNGTVLLSGASGGDLKLEGDFDDNGAFTANGRAVFFEGGNTQTINSTTDPLEIDVMRIGKSGGEVVMNQNLLADETSDPIQFTTATSYLNLNGNTLTIGKAGVTSSGSFTAGSGLKGTSASSLVLLGNGSFGDIPFVSGSQTLNNLSINRGSSGSIGLGSDVTVEGTLTFTQGDLQTNSNKAALGASASITETGGTVIGNLEATRTLSNSTLENFGGIGLSITPSCENLGSTVVTRTTGTPISNNSLNSISRYFQVTPTTNGKATVIFSYTDSEISAFTETNLLLFTSTDNSADSWYQVNGNPTITAGNNTLQMTVNNLNYFTFSDNSGFGEGDLYIERPGSGYALDFDGSNDHIIVPSNSSLNLSSGFTVEQWIYPHSTASTFSHKGHYTSVSDNSGWTARVDGTNQIRWYLEDNGETLLESTSNSITLNDWNHVALVYNGSETKIYINGVLNVSASNTIGDHSLYDYYIGARAHGALARYYNGEIDEVRIWNTALTDSQIRERMCKKITSEDALLCNLMAYYRFDENTGTTLFDYAGGNNGTITNGPTYALSGAAIGDESAYSYGNGNSTTVTEAHADGSSLKIDGFAGTPDGAHVYLVNESPNSTTESLSGALDATRYYGTFVVGGTSPTHTVTYDYTGNTNITGGTEAQAVLASRGDNSVSTWSKASTNFNLNQSTDEITVCGVSENQEYAGGFDVVLQERPGSGYALDFDGTNDQVVASTSLSGANGTWEAWVHSADWIHGDERLFGNGIDYGVSNSVYISTHNVVGLHFRLGGTVDAGNDYVASTASQSFVAGSWHHLAATWSESAGTITLKLYLDGVLAATNTSTYVPSFGSTMYIGGSAGLPFHDGKMDEVRIWNKALSQSEIQNWMCKKVTLDHSNYCNLLAYYRFDENTGTTAYDYTGNYNGTLSGGPTYTLSSAAIGDESTNSYGNGNSTSVTETHSDGSSFKIDNFTGTPDGAHVYLVNEAPNSTTESLSGNLEDTRYYGTFVVGGTSPSYNITYDYSANTNITGGTEAEARLGARNDNSGTTWTTITNNADLNQENNTITKGCYSATQKEFIAGFDDTEEFALEPSSGYALDFNGTTSYVELGNAAALTFTTAMTVECWFKTTSTLGNYQTLVSKWYSGGAVDGGSYALGFHSGGLQFSLQDEEGASANDFLGANYSSGLSLNDGVWHHVAGTWDGTSAKIYVDGILRDTQTSASMGASLDGNTRKVRIGTDDRFAVGTGDRFFPGQIDEVRFWDTPLNISDIQNWMNRKISPDHPDYCNLKGYYRFDEDTGTILKDYTGNTDGTISGATYQTSSAPTGGDGAINATSVTDATTLNLASAAGDDITVNVTSGTADLLQLFRVDGEANNKTAPGTIDNMSKYNYFGVKAFGANSLVYEVVYNWDGHAGITDESELYLCSRADNASSWTLTAATRDTDANTLTLGGQTGTEFILGSGIPGNALPVDLLDFKIENKEGKANLIWVTASEINSKSFEILRSTDAKKWEKVGEVMAQGNSNTLSNYQYTDNEKLNGNFAYYKLKQIDMNGEFTFSNALLFETENNIQTKIYPNPTSDNLTFQFGNNVERNIKISNLMGEQIMSLPTISNRVFNVNISKLPKGFYFVEIESGGQVEVKKILKQ